jgi:type VI secretion system secreted protein VgrG
MPSPTQEHRNIAISTPLGDDALLVSSVAITEQMGRLFRIEAELYSKDDVNFDDIVGQNATFRLEMGKGATRYFNAMISRFVQTRVDGKFTRYQATFVPWLWFLTRTADCRIFQQKTIPEIFGEVFRGHGFSDFRLSLSGNYPKWDYCVQYRETDFNFVSRLMEQVGIYYFFEHENGKHTLVLADSGAAHKPYPGCAQVIFRPAHAAESGGGEFMQDWVMEQNLMPGLYAHADYDFEKPRNSLQSKSSIISPHTQAGFEIFDYPGEFKDSATGEANARVRIEELHSDQEVFRGGSNVRGLAVGSVFDLSDHPRGDLNRGYLVTMASYHIKGDDAQAGGVGGGEFFTATVTAMDSSKPFRSGRTTPKPMVQGPQTAVVVGPSGEEIYTDKYGRVKVQFFWDRYGKANENSSCWIRVSQLWAGKSWGAIYIPRIGQEVIVEFLEGDPDRPIITGRVYNGEAMPPYALPAEKTKSTIKSNSSKGGNGFNEIRFEDRKGEEQIFIHAEKDEDIRVKNDAREWVGNERHLLVKKSQFEQVESDKHSTVQGDRLSKIGGDHYEQTVGGHFEKVDGDDHLKVGGMQNCAIGADASFKVGGNWNQEAGGKISLKAGSDIHVKAGTAYALAAGSSVHIKAGATLVIEAGAQLSLKVGGNFIDINPGGVFIKGTLVMINSGGAAGSGSGSSPDAPVAPEPPDPPKEPKKADDAKSGAVTTASAAPATKPKGASSSTKVAAYSPAASVLKQAAKDGTPFCEECERAKQAQEEGTA